ncbi:11001_t:CDS:1, partial [Scutellospora calospora]
NLINTTSNASAPSEIEPDVVGTTYRTSEHFVITVVGNKNVWKCIHCNIKNYSIKTSRTYLKEHVLFRCPSSPLHNTQNNTSQLITKEDMNKTITDLVVGTGVSFNILNNPLFHKMAKNLQYVSKLYKVPHPTTISRYLTGNLFNLRFNIIKSILAESSGRISLTCDRWHSTIHKCHYVVITESWFSDNWRIINIILSFQQSGQTAEDIFLVIMNILEKYSIKEKMFALTMDNIATNKA